MKHIRLLICILLSLFSLNVFAHKYEDNTQAVSGKDSGVAINQKLALLNIVFLQGQ